MICILANAQLEARVVFNASLSKLLLASREMFTEASETI
jgi:hypothetical protein